MDLPDPAMLWSLEEWVRRPKGRVRHAIVTVAVGFRPIHLPSWMRLDGAPICGLADEYLSIAAKSMRPCMICSELLERLEHEANRELANRLLIDFESLLFRNLEMRRLGWSQIDRALDPLRELLIHGEAA
jgi:hypothetical protein